MKSIQVQETGFKWQNLWHVYMSLGLITWIVQHQNIPECGSTGHQPQKVYYPSIAGGAINKKNHKTIYVHAL